MDAKHAMLYPPIDGSAVSQQQRDLAARELGLPVEAPPSYDMAMASEAPSGSRGVAVGWHPQPQLQHQQGSSGMVFQPIDPQHQHTLAPPRESARPVIVEQPQMPALPPRQQPIQSPVHQPPVPQTINIAVGMSQQSKLGPNPCLATCPSCGTTKRTRVTYAPNSRTHLCALLLCLVGCCCCACCVPYCMNSCRTGNHYCAKCSTFLGTYNPGEE